MRRRWSKVKYKVRIEQDDTSTKLWTLTELINYLRSFIKSRWDTITISCTNTHIIIERIG